MRIVIDARFYGLRNTGIGRYLVNLLRELGRRDRKNEYWVLLRQEGMREFEEPNERWHKVEVDVPHYTLREQLVLPVKLLGLAPDVVYVPHFNVPILWGGRMVVTIHDLLWHEQRGGQVTTLPPGLYWVKYLGFRLVFWWAVVKAKAILVPSRWVKQQLIKQYSRVRGKVRVAYEGVDEKIRNPKHEIRNQVLRKYGLERGKYLLYVGNVYPHKNLETLLGALKFLPEELVLTVVCGRELFKERFDKLVKRYGAKGRVRWLGYVSDEELAGLYGGAGTFVFPSLSEGFGLPALEAMALGCPVVAARSSSLPEVLNAAAMFFEPKDEKDLAKKVKQVLGRKRWRNEMVKKGRVRVKDFGWEKMAGHVLEAFEKVGG